MIGLKSPYTEVKSGVLFVQEIDESWTNKDNVLWKATFFESFFVMGLYKQVIKSVPLFTDLNEKKLGLLEVSGSVRKFPAKNVVFQEGEPGEVLLIILSGKVKVLL